MAEPSATLESQIPGQPVAAMSFEEALAELEGIVQKLERGQLDLESSIQAYERGTALRAHCAEKLRQVQLRVERLTLDREGQPKLQPFEDA
ncbi:MAG: exodeoxyribonuclease VII small subunit [Geminicoccaceae bacterium]